MSVRLWTFIGMIVQARDKLNQSLNAFLYLTLNAGPLFRMNIL